MYLVDLDARNNTLLLETVDKFLTRQGRLIEGLLKENRA